MTDEIFVSEKTGKRYRYEPSCIDLPKTLYGILTEIIEPKMEVGDFVAYSDKNGEHSGVFRYRGIMGNSLEYVYEIRKANGEVWLKENNEWVKK